MKTWETEEGVNEYDKEKNDLIWKDIQIPPDHLFVTHS
jgi:hypothetical protein